jgi:multidrug efflux pump subunit AcrB
MERIVRFFTLYPVWTNVLFFAVLFFGILVLSQMKYSFFPETPPDVINVSVTYPGASPEEIEEGIILKIEENVEGLEGIDRVTSISRENFGSVRIEIISGYDVDKLTNDVKNAVDRINSFPVGIEKPVVAEQKFQDAVMTIVMAGKTDRYQLKYIADRFRDDLILTEEISQAEIGGLPNLEISIEVSEEKLRRYGLSFTEIANAVRGFNINLSGGKFETRDEEILIRGYNRQYYAEEFDNIAVRGGRDGSVVFLRDVATVREKWEDSPEKVYFNGKPAVVLSISKTISEDILAIRERAQELIDQFNAEDNGIRMEILDDRTIALRGRLSLMINNGLLGLLLVIISLTFFMNLRLSFWVAIGIPFSFAGMFIFAGLYGITINVISLFGMIIVVGILVDDAVVVGENIYSHYERGKKPLQAVIDGTIEVFPAVVTSVATTIIAFLPYFFLDGRLGKFIWHVSLVVILSLIFSLIESLLILPAHLAHSKGLHPHKEDKPMRRRIENLIKWFTNDVYGPFLNRSMRHKWFTMAMPLALTLLVVGLLRGGFIKATFFPFIDGDTMPVNLSLTPGTQEHITDSLLARIEALAPAVNDRLREMRDDDADVLIKVRRQIGSNDFGETGSHTGKLNFELLPGEEREMDSFIIANIMREMTGEIPAAEKITFGQAGIFGRAVSLSLLGNNIDELQNAKATLKRELGAMDELKDITDSDQVGLREIRLELKPRAYALGLTLADVANQVRDGFFGREIQRLQRGRDEIKVWVRYREADRASIDKLREMRIRTADGRAFPFTEVATFHMDRGLILINHLDRLREIKVEADMVNPEGDIANILDYIRNEVMPEILAANPGVRVSYEGQSRSQQKVARSAQKAFPLALAGIVILMILVFRSYLQSLLVFGLIPLGVVGAFIGHGIHGIPVNMLSLFGIIALSGIIVNDSIVFIDQINRNLRKGMEVVAAVHKAGISRMRPILLTTFTTVLGLGPLILEKSRQAQFLIPMAVSVAYGLILTTFLILLILPSAFLVLNRLRLGWYRHIRGQQVSARDVEPAIREMRHLQKWEGQQNEA